jgi:hypothetical protein
VLLTLLKHFITWNFIFDIFYAIASRRREEKRGEGKEEGRRGVGKEEERKEGGREGRKEGGKEGRKEGEKEGRKEDKGFPINNFDTLPDPHFKSLNIGTRSILVLAGQNSSL